MLYHFFILEKSLSNTKKFNLSSYDYDYDYDYDYYYKSTKIEYLPK